MSLGAADHNDRKLGTERSLTESRIEREGLTPGTPAPAFSLPAVAGGAVSLEGYRGRQVLLVFSDPHCGPCDALAPDLVRLQTEIPNLQLLMVGRGDLEENRAKAREYGLPFPVVVQAKWEISRKYGIFATPVAFLIDEDGVIAQSVAIGADAILTLAHTVPAAPPAPVSPIAAAAALAITRWRALGRIAAALAAGFFISATGSASISLTIRRIAAGVVSPAPAGSASTEFAHHVRVVRSRAWGSASTSPAIRTTAASAATSAARERSAEMAFALRLELPKVSPDQAHPVRPIRRAHRASARTAVVWDVRRVSSCATGRAST